jgi:hypothetical protein
MPVIALGLPYGPEQERRADESCTRGGRGGDDGDIGGRDVCQRAGQFSESGGSVTEAVRRRGGCAVAVGAGRALELGNESLLA